jgi:hypothetical protein
MLILSTLFMFIAVVAMFIEARRWGPEYWNTSSARPNVMLIQSDAPTVG